MWKLLVEKYFDIEINEEDNQLSQQVSVLLVQPNLLGYR
jgi:hypothetical protein